MAIQITSRRVAGQFLRNPLIAPFASTSIWNAPIGASAAYVPAGFDRTPATYSTMPYGDPMRVCLTPSAPLTDIRYSSAGWSGTSRCSPTSSQVLDTVPIPTNYLVPSSNQNEGAVFLRPDGRTYITGQPIARCTAGQPATAIITMASDDIYGTGLAGGHGGSGMSILGGLLRLGELRPGGTGPRHAIKFIIATARYLYKATQESDTFRWPATTSDSGAVGIYGQTTNNQNTAMKMGSLVALLPSSTLPSTLRTEPGRQLAWTMQNYGAYIVDGTGDDFLIATEEGYHGSFIDQFAADYGFAFNQRANDQTPWVQDIQDILVALYVVNNNSPTTIGGGGAPRQPLAAPLAGA